MAHLTLPSTWGKMRLGYKSGISGRVNRFINGRSDFREEPRVSNQSMMETPSMSSNERWLGSALCVYSLVCSALSNASAQPKQSLTTLACPATIEVIESVAPISGWSAGPATRQRSFERISIYNGKAGGREFELAPDNQKQEGNRVTQTWSLKGYRKMNVFLRCRYRDTPVVLYRDVPSQIETCTLRFSTGSNGQIIGRSEMGCS